MHHPYEVRFVRRGGRLSLLLVASYASDHQAIDSARQWLRGDLPHAAISHNGRPVAEVDVQADTPSAAEGGALRLFAGLNIGNFDLRSSE